MDSNQGDADKRSLADKLNKLQQAARRHADGHFSILGFTTNVKAFLGTMYEGHPQSLVILHARPGFRTIEQAVDWLLHQIELEELFPLLNTNQLLSRV